MLRRRSLHLPVSAKPVQNNNAQANTNANENQAGRSNAQSTATGPPMPITESECTLQMIYAKLTNLEETNHRFLHQLNELRNENAELKSKINILESKLNWQQQHLLSNFIEIVGVPNVNDKNACSMAKQIFNKALSIDEV